MKLLLFKSYCMSLYGVAIWKYLSATVFNKFRSCYNKCINKVFGYSRMDSMSRIVINLSLPAADTIVYNSRISFDQHCFVSCNMTV